MPLEEYARKRKFGATPEPAPGAVASSGSAQGSFCIQRHDATRLHYDFRLEIDGTLKSWAVPKGPSLVPLAKQLAMQVEDHPVDYGGFEGNIPKGNYGAGSVMLWDRGAFDQLGTGTALEQIARGDLKFRLHGEKLKGEFAIVRMKGRGKGPGKGPDKSNEWLLIKKRDEFADQNFDIETLAWSVSTGRTQEEIAADLPAVAMHHAVTLKPADLPGAKLAPMPENVTPMSANASASPPPGSGWVYEIKWDGVRAVVFVDSGKLRMISRNGNSYDRQYPELSVIPHQIAAETAILDGEIALLDENGRSSFELMQPRIHQTDANSIAHLARTAPVKLYAFDLIYWDGYDLRDVPLVERKRALAAIVKPSDRLQVSDHFNVPGDQMLEAAAQMGLEGIMAKQANSKYEERRSKSWMKVKITTRQEFVICGYTHGERDTFSSLVLGVRDEAGELRWVGNVGTGFDDRMLRDLWAKLRAMERPDPPFPTVPAMLRKATWVEPVMVCECKFLEWTRGGRLRAPVYLGLRNDKPAPQVVREQAEVAAETAASAIAAPRVKEALVDVDGQQLKLTNLDKIWYPKDKVTKRDAINYYNDVAEYLVPHLKDRPLSLKRYPNGIHEEFFFQKNTPDSYPGWLRTETIESTRFIVANDRATLLYLANLGCIDQNPWMSRVQSLENPDYILIDLDPVECAFNKIVEALLLVKEVLDQLGLTGYPNTTGGDGAHIYIPIEPRYTYEQARSFAEILSQLALARKPDLFTTPRSVEKRKKNRVYFDYMQIAYSKTIAAPYVLRAYDGAPVATPLHWDEVLPGLSPHQFHIGNAIARFRQVGDLFRPVLTQPQKLEPALKRLAAMVAGPD